MDHDTLLDRYAALALQVGVDHREGQRLLVRSPISAAPLVRRITAAAYAGGAPFVDVHWSDEQLTRTRFHHAPADSFEELPLGRAEAMTEMVERGDAVMTVIGSDPNLLSEVDPERAATARAAHLRAMKPFSRKVMAHQVPWTVLAAPTPQWAAKVFPDEDGETATAKLWDVVFAVTRSDREDPVLAWREHAEALQVRASYLDDRRFASVRFSGPGTDLTVGLADEHVWTGGASTAASGQNFVPNLPTEEVFTAPHRDRVDGTVRASMPLAYDGRVVKDFQLTFEGGRVTSFRAAQGEEVLERLLGTDDGARRLGEVALVSRDSPVFESGLLFFNSLFDENAASHLALGQAYRISTREGASLSKEETVERGLNESLTHVDFMIGEAEMDVDGIFEDGAEEPLMRQGHFVI